MIWFFILVLVGVGGAVYVALRHAAMDKAVAPPAVPATNLVWPKSGAYACDVVGESHYQDALWRALKVHERHPDTPLLAVLTPEHNNPHDRNAVSVRIASQLVGHLPREIAPEYRRLLLGEGKGLVPVHAYARITGGFRLNDGSTAYLGLQLDIKDLENY